MNHDGTFNPDAVKAYSEGMRRICDAFRDALAVWQAGSGDIYLPDHNAPGEHFTVELNAADPEGFSICNLDGSRLEWGRSYVRALFKVVGIDPLAELVKLRDAGCTFGGTPVLSVVKKGG
jgi:hypothetical protein